MIYFDKNKQAYGQEVGELLCVVEDEDWREFSTLDLGVEYDVTEEGIVDLRQTSEYLAKEAEKERQRLDNLSLTKREVFLALYKDQGITPEQIKSQITDPEALIEFEYANDYFRGNPLINVIGQVLGYNTEQLDYLFENKELP